MAIEQNEPILASDFINESEADADPSENGGKVPKLEDNGRISPIFGGGGEIVEMTAGETIDGATTPVPVYLDTSDSEVYKCDPEDSSTNGSRKTKWIGLAVSDGTDGNPISVQLSGVVRGFSSLTPNRNYYLYETPGELSLYNKSFNGRGPIKVGRSISDTQIFLERGQLFYEDGHLAHNDETDVTVHECGFLPERIIVRVFPSYGGFGGDSNMIAWAYGNFSLFNDGTEYGGSGIRWSYDLDGSTQDSVSGSFGYDNPSGTRVINIDIDSVSDIGFTITTTPQNGGPNVDARVLVEAYGSF